MRGRVGEGVGAPYARPVGFIELVEVGYTFPGGRTLFDKVSFKVPDSERVALVGANGVGKTTLLRLIAEADNAHHGLIRVIGRLARMPQLVHDPRSPATSATCCSPRPRSSWDVRGPRW